MSIAIEGTIQVLQVVLQTVPIGTNLALLQLLWSIVSGSFLPSRGAIFPGLQLSGFNEVVTSKARVDGLPTTMKAIGRWPPTSPLSGGCG